MHLNFYLQSPAPQVVSVMPTANMYEVDLNAQVYVKFDQPMDTLTFNSANFILSAADSSVNGNFIRSDSTLTFFPILPLVQDKDYRVEVTTGIKSKAGIALSNHYVWKFSTGSPVALNEYESSIPEISLLVQNYPNPFNPSTTIKFSLPKSEFVELKVYNTLGEEVSTLISNKLNQGNHTFTFDGTYLVSGIYYYQLVAGKYLEVKKMILIK